MGADEFKAVLSFIILLIVVIVACGAIALLISYVMRFESVDKLIYKIGDIIL